METAIHLAPYIIAGISVIIAFISILSSFLRVKHSHKITLAKKDRSNITIHTKYNRVDSKRLIEYLNE
jgi:hypothetical protein